MKPETRCHLREGPSITHGSAFCLGRLTLLIEGYNKSREGIFNVITALEVAAISRWLRGMGAVVAGKLPPPAFPSRAEGYGEALLNLNENFAVPLD